MAVHLDELDRGIIALLRADSRTSVSALAERLGVVRATVQARINRLVSTGVIAGFTIAMGPGYEEQKAVRAVCSLLVHSSTPRSTLHRQLIGVPGVQSIHTTTGKWDVVVQLTAPDLDSLDHTLALLRALPVVEATETSILVAPLAP